MTSETDKFFGPQASSSTTDGKELQSMQDQTRLMKEFRDAKCSYEAKLAQRETQLAAVSSELRRVTSLLFQMQFGFSPYAAPSTMRPPFGGGDQLPYEQTWMQGSNYPARPLHHPIASPPELSHQQMENPSVDFVEHNNQEPKSQSMEDQMKLMRKFYEAKLAECEQQLRATTIELADANSRMQMQFGFPTNNFAPTMWDPTFGGAVDQLPHQEKQEQRVNPCYDCGQFNKGQSVNPSCDFGQFSKVYDLNNSVSLSRHPSASSRGTGDGQSVNPNCDFGQFSKDSNARAERYETWMAFIKNYLVAEDLWDVIERSTEPEAEFAHRRRKNAKVLHALHNACPPDTLAQIRNITDAKTAWKTLADLANPQSEGPENTDCPTFVDLRKHVCKGDWTATNDFLIQNPSAITAKISSEGWTALQIAADAGNVEIVKMLVGKMSREDLGIKNNSGDTALHIASVTGIKEIAQCMIDKNNNLLNIKNGRGYIPLVSAGAANDEDMTRYLYSVTSCELLSPENGDLNGPCFLHNCIIDRMFDIALHLLRKYPNLAIAKDETGVNALMQLSVMPYAFQSGTELIFWKRWICSRIRVQPLECDGDFKYIESRSDFKSNMPLVLCGMREMITNLLEHLGIKRVYDMKHAHQRYMQILREVCNHVQTLKVCDHKEKGVNRSFCSAVKNGVVEFVLEMVKVKPELLYTTDDETSRGMFMSAIQHRQEKIFSLFYGLEANKGRFICAVDKFNNTMLHMAGMLSPSSQLACISGAALQMQSELQWYKEVESIISPTDKSIINDDGETASELFSRHHKDLMIEGEKWMKETATSSTVVGALIITVMFAAAFTVPGGSIQDIGVPVFKNKIPFKTFIIADAISLFASSTSVLMFLGILTSRYAEDDFLISLPRKLIIGLSTLFISIAAMMVAFCATLILTLDNQLGLIIPLVLLACVPVSLFILLQFPLLVKIFVSTYGPGIFDRKNIELVKCLKC